MSQLTIFDALADPTLNRAGRARRNARPTEAAAAALVKPRAGTQRMAALLAFRAAGHVGLTDSELEAATGIYLYSIAPRRLELLKGGWVEDSGRTRRSPRGVDTVVWILTDAAHRELGE